jgi:hypothetical protein
VVRYAHAGAASRQPLILVLTNFALPAVRSQLAAGADFLDKVQQFDCLRPLILQGRGSGAA